MGEGKVVGQALNSSPQYGQEGFGACASLKEHTRGRERS